MKEKLENNGCDSSMYVTQSKFTSGSKFFQFRLIYRFIVGYKNELGRHDYLKIFLSLQLELWFFFRTDQTKKMNMFS